MKNLTTIPVFVFLVFFFVSCSSDSEEPNPEPDTVAPTVDFSIVGFPETDGNIVLSNQITINISAEDARGIVLVEAFIDDVKVGEDRSNPYEINIDLSNFGQNGTVIGYTLRVDATDTSNNVSSVQRMISVDNEMPLIANLSLEEGNIINGEDNEVTFDVMDNDELKSVKVFINDLEINVLQDISFQTNINTSSLSDGSNKLRIEALDSANNLSVFEVNFISDNTGPEISLENINPDQILDEMIALQPSVMDTYSELSSLEILFREESLSLFENPANTSLNFDPNNFATGEGIFSFIALDDLGNSSTLDVPVEIMRLLYRIDIPEGYLSPNIFAQHFVFANSPNGDVIDSKEIIFETRQVRLRSTEELESLGTFSVTFASLGNNGGTSFLFSIMDISTDIPNNLNLRVPRRFNVNSAVFYPIVGFDSATRLFAFGRDYSFSSDAEGRTLLGTFSPVDHSFESDEIYIYGFNPLNNFYTYQFVDKQIPSDFEYNFSDFSTANLISNQFSTIPSNFINENSSSLTLFGYRNLENLENDIHQTVWSFGFGQFILQSEYEYPVNEEFFAFSHEVTIGNYRSQGINLPPSIIEIPNWSIDFSFENNEVSLSKSGSGFTNGEIYFEGGFEEGIPYVWNIVFNGNQDNVTLPQLPEAIQNFDFFNQLNTNNLQLNRVSLLKYDNVNTYSDFLTSIIFQNTFFNRSAPRFESIFKSVNGGYQTFSSSSRDFLFNQF